MRIITKFSLFESSQELDPIASLDPEMQDTIIEAIVDSLRKGGPDAFSLASGVKNSLPYVSDEINKRYPDLGLDQFAQADSWGF
jgi:hypothetical protein